VYDIFAFYPQTLQGADILAYGDKERPVQVFMPDLFDGKPADIAWYPPDTEEKGKKLGAFLGSTADQPKNVERVSKLMALMQSNYPYLTTWGIVGYCWGGKVTFSFVGCAACIQDRQSIEMLTVVLL
jgi:dienelactone hydrolase